MNLKEFIEAYVCRNTLIRLWIQFAGGYKMIFSGNKEVAMEWKTLNGSSFQSDFLDRKVVGVTDILCDTYIEAVNIVIE